MWFPYIPRMTLHREQGSLFSLNQKVVICRQLKEMELQQGLIQDPRLSWQEILQIRSGPQGFRGATPPGLFSEGPLLDRERWLGTEDTLCPTGWPLRARPLAWGPECLHPHSGVFEDRSASPHLPASWLPSPTHILLDPEASCLPWTHRRGPRPLQLHGEHTQRPGEQRPCTPTWAAALRPETFHTRPRTKASLITPALFSSYSRNATYELPSELLQKMLSTLPRMIHKHHRPESWETPAFLSSLYVWTWSSALFSSLRLRDYWINPLTHFLLDFKLWDI